MLSCWNETPESRPLFHELAKKISRMLDQNVAEHYISLNEPYYKENETRSIFDQTDYLKLITSLPKQIAQVSKNDSDPIEKDVAFDDTAYCPFKKIQVISENPTLEISV